MVQNNHHFRFGSFSALREIASALALAPAPSSYQQTMAKVHNNHHPFRSSLAYVGSNFGVTSHVCSRSSQSMRAIDLDHSRNIEPVQSIYLKMLQQECHSPQRLEIQSERGSASALALGFIYLFIYFNGRDCVHEVKDLGEGQRFKERGSSSALGGETEEIQNSRVILLKKIKLK